MLGPRIAALRQLSGMKQAELAEKLGVSTSAVGMYEQGRREPGTQLLVKLAKVFSVTTDYLLTGNPVTASDADKLRLCLQRSLAVNAGRSHTESMGFSRDELSLLLTAMLTEP